ncbi:hypothetical protein ES705_17673 [subsurface metagenome]
MRNKRILTLITLLLCLLLLVGCKARNQAPIITSIPITAVELGETYTYDVNATDPEGATLAYSLITKPTGMTITSTTGLIKWTPKAEGNFAVAVKVSDGVLYIIQSFTITVSKPPAPPPIVNYAPIITSIPGDIAIIGVAYLYDVNATDPNGDTLTYSLTKNPDDMTINSTTGIINWDPQIKDVGYHKVIVKVSDGDLATTQSFTITVPAVEPEPEIVLTGIEVDPNTMTLFVGEKDFFKVTANYNDNTTKNVTNDCVYVSNDPTIAKVLLVSPSNLQKSVEAVKKGMAEITVSYGSQTDKVVIRVVETIQDAIDAAKPGDTIEVPAGTYPEAITINKQLTLLGANAGVDPVTGARGDESIIDGLVNVNQSATINGFTIQSSPTRYGIVQGATGEALTIENNIVEGAEKGIVLHNSAGNTISNNLIKNSLHAGICLQIIENSIISGNKVTGTIATVPVTPTQGGGAIQIGSKTQNNIISHNTLINNGGAGIYFSRFSRGTGNKINYNNIVGNTEYGIYNGATLLVDATDNWWGDTTGPTHPTNFDGKGDAVSDDVDFADWSKSEF